MVISKAAAVNLIMLMLVTDRVSILKNYDISRWRNEIISDANLVTEPELDHVSILHSTVVRMVESIHLSKEDMKIIVSIPR